MKKALTFLMCAILALSLAACGGKAEYTAADFSLYDTETKNTISIGMTKDEVEKLCGNSSENSMGIYNYSGLHIGYRDGVVALLSIRSEEENSANFETSKGITANSSFADFFKEYPTAAKLNKSGYLYLYKDNETYMDISSEYKADSSPRFPEKYSTKNIFVIALDSPEKNAERPEALYVTDYDAMMLMNLDK